MKDPTERLRNEAKMLLKAAKGGDSDAIRRLDGPLRLSQAQHAVAREQGYRSWPKLKLALGAQELATSESDVVFQRATRAILGHGYDTPKRDLGAAIIAARPDLPRDLPTSAGLWGEVHAVRAAQSWSEPIDEEGRGLLHHVCASPMQSATACLRWALEHGVDPNAAHPWSQDPTWKLSPLYYAAGVANDPERTRLLLAAGADPNDMECLYHSVEHDELRCTAILVEGGARWPGTNAFQRALDFESLRNVELCLELGADPNDGKTPPLHHAMKRGRSRPILEALIAAGADPTKIDEDDRNAYDWAERTGHTWMLSGGQPQDRPNRAFLAACARGDLTDAKKLHPGFENLADEDLRLLPDLVRLGKYEAVETMLALGWPIDVKREFAPSLNHAAFDGDPKMAKLLLDAGAHWTEPNDYGGDAWGSIWWASRNLGSKARVGKHVEVAQLFLSAGSPLPHDLTGASEEVTTFLEEFAADHPDWPRDDLT